MIQGPKRWFGSRLETYRALLTALGLNLPLYVAALAHQLEGVPLLSLAGAYAAFVIVGYYGLALLVLLTVLFLVTGFSRRLAVAAGATFLFAAAFYLVADSVVHRAFRFHIDAFWLQYVFTSFNGFGMPPATLALIAGVLVVLVAIELWILRLARRVRPPRLATGLLVIGILTCFVVSQVMHVIAYYRSDTRITSITPQLPFYAPIVSQNQAARYASLVGTGVSEAEATPGSASLRYPLREVRPAAGSSTPNIVLLLLESWRYDMMDSRVTPNVDALGRRSSVFLRHLSSGNSTPTGVFGLFYGIHPTYWPAVKANSAVIDNPVLIDVLKEKGYAFGIFADSQFGRHKIKDAMFRGIPIHESFTGRFADDRDDDMTNQLIGFMDEQHAAGKPFFGFAFFKSTHYAYCYPPAAARFQPAKDLNIATAGNDTDTTPFVNDCRNSVFYTDSLMGRILRHLEAAGLMENTIVIVTSDHGEEFNDNHAGWWGHSGNFTRYQTQVPLVFYFPGRAPRRVTQMTAHVDVPTTLLEEVFGCGPPDDYSNGRDLFALSAEPRPFVVSGYVNHAFVMGDDVHSIYPMFVQSYKLDDIHAHAGAPDPELARRLMEETHRFYPGAVPGAPPRAPGSKAKGQRASVTMH
jgi:membrane-anchored protein YejM (alkaline phosphatase superfamily)